MSNKIKFYNRQGEIAAKPANIKIEPRLSVYGIAIVNNEILMVTPVWNKKWELPGGKIEKKESEDIALAREYYEETGYKIRNMDKNPIREVESYFYHEGKDKYFKSMRKYYAITDLLHDKNSKYDQKEIKKCAWVDIFSLKSKNCHKDSLNIIKSFIKQIIGKG